MRNKKKDKDPPKGYIVWDLEKHRFVTRALDSREDAEDFAEPWPNKTKIIEIR